MHMADALISPAVGGAMYAAAGTTLACSARKVRASLDEKKAPLMGVLGAFVFAAQMINFSIPGTGSSGHLVGGLLLAILLGPEAALLVIASVLVVQALLFADGGLLALGCNIVNMGVTSAFVAFPLVWRRLVGDPLTVSRGRVMLASVLAAVAGLELGALGVVLETTASGISALPFGKFILLMLPIHVAIGAVEGLVTGAVVLFLREAQPDLLDRAARRQSLGGLRLRPVLAGFAVAALVTGGVVAWFASPYADGLEWSIAKVTGSEELAAPATAAHEASTEVQEKTAILPDYAFPAGGPARAGEAEPAWPAVDAGTTVSGVAGALVVLAVVVLAGLVLRRRATAPRSSQ